MQRIKMQGRRKGGYGFMSKESLETNRLQSYQPHIQTGIYLVYIYIYIYIERAISAETKTINCP